MLERIPLIQGVGLFNKATGGARYKLPSKTLIYADNGRGKSTLTSILGSCASGEDSQVRDRKTIDSKLPQAVTLIFSNGNKIAFQNGTWTTRTPEIRVYDGNFIERNVYSGIAITSDHKRNLLDFALGQAAVSARQDEKTATAEWKEASGNVSDLSAKIASHVGRGADISELLAAPAIEDVDSLIEAAHKRIQEIDRSDSIRQLPIPREHNVPTLDIDRLQDILNTTIENVDSSADEIVNQHLSMLDTPIDAKWIADGFSMPTHDVCPYCGQPTADIELVRMYASYFNTEYSEFQKHLDAIEFEVSRMTSPDQIAKLAKLRDVVNSQLSTWGEYVDTQQIDSSSDATSKLILENINDLVSGLIAKKRAAPGQPQMTQDQNDEVRLLWRQFVSVIESENALIRSANITIREFLSSLDAASKQVILRNLDGLELSKLRHSATISKLVDSLNIAKDNLARAEHAKKDARDQLSKVMNSTLSQYGADVNVHLEKLGAKFSIKALKTNFRAKTPGTDYQIELRGQPVPIAGGAPSFATALSDGDKRTMAFAFFAASALADDNLEKEVVVIDDPMSSLDRSRRSYTIDLICRMASRAEQTIILAHDPSFLRALKKRWESGDKSLQVRSLEICSAAQGYSDFQESDLDELCETEYLRNFRMVSELVDNGSTTISTFVVAEALRPLLEGYLHRKFPNSVSEGCMLGTIISLIESSDTSSPLNRMAAQVPEMREICFFANHFHHDTEPDYQGGFLDHADESEVIAYGKRILDLIYSQ